VSSPCAVPFIVDAPDSAKVILDVPTKLSNLRFKGVCFRCYHGTSLAPIKSRLLENVDSPLQNPHAANEVGDRFADRADVQQQSVFYGAERGFVSASR
jgi:hypothetical protein